MSAPAAAPGDPALSCGPSFEVRAEILKLARLVGRDPLQLEYLQQLPAAEIRQLREQITDMLFAVHGHAFTRLAAAGRILPATLVAFMAEHVFGPVLAARIAGLLDASHAVNVAARLPTTFLADLALHLDPRRASEVIARIPPRQAAEITRELVQRGEYVTLAGFVGHLPDEAIVAALAVIDDAMLVQIAFVLEHKDRVGHLISLLPSERLDGVVAAAAGASLWLEALRLLTQLDEALQATLVERVAALDAAYRQLIAQRALAAGVLDQLGPLGEALRALQPRP
jgi:hypothetical protein